MVFAIGSNGKACVYHWPFHQWKEEYITKMSDTIADHGVNGTIQYLVYGMGAPKGSNSEKIQENAGEWRTFATRFATRFGQPAVYIVEEPYTNPILTYRNGQVTAVQPNQRLV
jgi:hypothetical protein